MNMKNSRANGSTGWMSKLWGRGSTSRSSSRNNQSQNHPALASRGVTPTEAMKNPASDENVVNLVKGIAITHLQRQCSAFEVFLSEMEGLRNQVEIVSPEYWPRAAQKSKDTVNSKLMETHKQAAEDAVRHIGYISETQRDMASSTWELVAIVANQFYYEHISLWIETVFRGLSNHSALNWPIILQARLHIAQEYAKTVSTITNMATLHATSPYRNATQQPAVVEDAPHSTIEPVNDAYAPSLPYIIIHDVPNPETGNSSGTPYADPSVPVPVVHGNSNFDADGHPHEQSLPVSDTNAKLKHAKTKEAELEDTSEPY